MTSNETPIRFGDRVVVVYNDILITGSGWLERVESPCGPFLAAAFLWDGHGQLHMVPFGAMTKCRGFLRGRCLNSPCDGVHHSNAIDGNWTEDIREPSDTPAQAEPSPSPEEWDRARGTTGGGK
jgi:hypothetical protein